MTNDYTVSEKQLNNLAAYFNGVIDNIKCNDTAKAAELARLGVEMINYQLLKRAPDDGTTANATSLIAAINAKHVQAGE